MKTNKLLIFTVFLITLNCFSQVGVNIQSLQYTNNGESTQNPTNCGTIDLKSSTSTSINFSVNLNKPNGQSVGLSDLYIYTKKSSSSFRVQQGGSVSIPGSFWNHPLSGDDTYSTTLSCTINAIDFNVSGGTLYVVFKSSSNIEYLSCNYSIVKDQLPQFNLQPTSVVLDCGSTGTRVFTAVNVNNSPGTVSYSWNVGSGWKYNGVPVNGTFTTTTAVIYLEPVSGTTIPSNVTMTATLNGVSYPPKTATITRSNITKTITAIQGVSTFCSGSANYNFGTENVFPGQSVSWSFIKQHGC